MFSARILRKRWFLGVIFFLSLLYFMSNTLTQNPISFVEENTNISPSRPPFQWKAEFEPKNHTYTNKCRNSLQGKHVVVDEKGCVCPRISLLPNGCCNQEREDAFLHTCETCNEHGCCSVYENCVSCCLRPDKQIVLQGVLGKAGKAFGILFSSVYDHYELCLTKCRTSSLSVQHENTYRDPEMKHCYGDDLPAPQGSN
ncbi:UPF0454 protein C12orf49 homolog [Anneissia japonica]|uniref:UPF0454 protein C12orf49 homolog n=1 Tax=Anneissia japonica TaxID=1529436 RepID=UPI0014256158|nr:UPF0454 protein C12orf49 homolog [Anneissia japonica]XP_033099519.1 UPF0454 protein C12orf49 homolog [Anneissia japonica]